VSALTLEALDEQEARFAAAFAAGDITQARSLYRPDVVYLSPTTRLYGWPRRVEGRERTLEFIALTIAGLANVSYEVVERALVGSASAYVLVHFDFDTAETRLRSRYVVVYRYGDGGIARQELYYDPSDRLERRDPE
jgi:ketosteroid isomerase-like protein